jgi:hypothetical protein
LESKFKSGTWWAKGSAWHFTKGITGKAWDATLDATMRNVSSLLSKAAHQLDVSSNWKSYFRSQESFLGKEVKKSLPITVSDLLLKYEADYLSRTHAQPIEDYRNLLKMLSNPTEGDLPSLSETIKKVGQGLLPLCASYDRVIAHRISTILPSQSKDRRKAKKVPMKELVSKLGFEQYITAFDPLIWVGQKPFVIDQKFLDEADDVSAAWKELLRSYKNRIITAKRLGHDDIVVFAESFARDNFPTEE